MSSLNHLLSISVGKSEDQHSNHNPLRPAELFESLHATARRLGWVQIRCIFVINRCFSRIYPDFVWHFKLWKVTNPHLSPGFWKVVGWDEDLLILELILDDWQVQPCFKVPLQAPNQQTAGFFQNVFLAKLANFLTDSGDDSGRPNLPSPFKTPGSSTTAPPSGPGIQF